MSRDATGGWTTGGSAVDTTRIRVFLETVVGLEANGFPADSFVFAVDFDRPQATLDLYAGGGPTDPPTVSLWFASIPERSEVLGTAGRRRHGLCSRTDRGQHAHGGPRQVARPLVLPAQPTPGRVMASKSSKSSRSAADSNSISRTTSRSVLSSFNDRLALPQPCRNRGVAPGPWRGQRCFPRSGAALLIRGDSRHARIGEHA